MEQVRLSESPSRKMPEGGTIRTVGATAEERCKEWVSLCLHTARKSYMKTKLIETDQQSRRKIEKRGGARKGRQEPNIRSEERDKVAEERVFNISFHGNEPTVLRLRHLLS